MAIVDEVEITIKAGDGGAGSTAAITTSNTKGFPDGGNGGRGGDIYFEASSNISDLSEFRYKKELKAENGVNGSRKGMDGRNGNHLTILVPLGTTISDLEKNTKIELTQNNQKILLAKGGIGGEGSKDYKLNLRNFRLQIVEGGVGQEKKLKLVLRIIAQVGLIGFPNAGKSSLLNALTNAKAKIGDYSFTTLEPNIGVFRKIVLADIPGLIEGAASGKGLGIQFLKHIEKTEVLLHCIDGTTKDVKYAYETVRKEFAQYDESLLKKKEVILLTKIDLLTKVELKEKVNLLKKLNKDVYPVSLVDEESIENLRTFLKTLSQ